MNLPILDVYDWKALLAWGCAFAAAAIVGVPLLLLIESRRNARG